MNFIDTHIVPDALGWLQHRAAKRYDTLENLEQVLRDRSAAASTATIKNKEIELYSHPDPQSRDDANKLLVGVNGEVTGFTHHSFNQIAGLAKAPSSYMRTLPAPLVKDNIEWGLRYNRDVEEVKAYYDGAELRALTGPDYGRVDDWQVVEAINKILDTGRWKPAQKHMGLSVTDRSLQLFLVDEANPIDVDSKVGDIMYKGLRIFNSELGYCRLGIEEFLFRLRCLNGMIIPESVGNVNIRHTKNAPYRWAREVQPAIEAYVNEDASLLVHQVERAKEAVLARDEEKAVEWLRNRAKLSVPQSREVLRRIADEEGSNRFTAWNAVNGITSLARDVTTAEDRADLERVAGRIFERVAA